MTPISSTRHSRSLRGFSAVEIIAVATIIAILALILLPMLRGRVEEAKRKAALDEMSQISKMVELSHADNDRYFRLQDLDNTDRFTGGTDDRISMVPFAYYLQDGSVTDLAANPGLRLQLSKTWKGPYTAVQNKVKLVDLAAMRPEVLSTAGGPLAVFTNETEDLYPLDPWGNPYLFFPTVETLYGASETSYQGRPVIFSMGPNGMPGGLITAAPADYSPATGPLGTDDDMVWNM